MLASSNYAEALADYGRRLAKAHQEFIASQQALHAEFLALRQHGSMLLLGVAGAQPAAVTHPLQPTAPAAPLLTRSGPARPTAHGTPTAPRQPPTAPRQPPTPNGTLPTASGTLPTGNGTLPIANGTLPTANGIAPSAQPSAPSTPHRAPSAQRPAPSAQRPAPSAQRSAPSAPRLAPSTQHPVPHAPTPSEPTTLSRDPVGRTWSREELRVHASGAISTIFDPTFAPQDKHAVQVRMPEPPLLLADRVVGIEAEPNALTNGKKNTGTVWTETDVRPNAWYLHRGHMPAGVMIESGQADLFLISYLGVDLLNQGERAYRLLGCELTYHGALPKVGETLRYEIDVDGHANQGDVRLFFFHYDCEVRGPTGNRPALSVRGGQAGFFTEQELAESAGVLWTPEEQTIVEQPRLDPPAVVCTKTSFSKDELEAFSRGDVPGCFGPGFEYAAPHNRTPRIAGDRMHFFDRVDECTPAGGPWGRGYLRATLDISTDDWFFEGHFKNDPCMPGTLMFEGCLQAMATYLTSLGYTLDKDGWRFEPIPEEKYALRCRGQVLPNAKVLTYEIFVEEVVAGPIPMLYADLLCTVDGLKAFHARRMGLRLVPDWPLEEWRDAPPSADAPSCAPQLTEDVASSIALLPLAAPPSASAVWPNDPNKRDFVFDYASLLACAWGKPSDAFGPMYGVFDSTRRVARLPGPPYHFMSRVTRINGELGACKPGAEIEIEYDVPEDVWYFAHGPNAPGVKLAMPFCVLLEAALQPCGWLASFVGSALTVDKDLSFRNLDGKGTVLAEVFPDSGVFRTVVKITNVSATAGMIIESFTVRCYVDHPDGTSTPAYELDTVFGFFPGEALENQVGLPTSDAQRAQLEGPSETAPIDLRTRPVCFCEGPLRLADPMLLMLDRITALEPKGGSEGLGFLRGEKDVDPNEWFFKAHFFQDPVQPGSLGIEAFLQLLQVYAIAQNLHEGMERPRFEAIACDHEHSWKYRGQVVPKNEVIGSTMEILEVLRDDAGVRLTGRASLWVDGKRIYEAPAIAIRVIDEAPEGDGRPKGRSLSETAGFGDGTRDAGRGTPDAGRGTPDAESGTRDAGRTTHDAESAMHDARRTTRDAESAMQVVGRGTQGAAGGAQGAGRRAQGAGRVARGAGRGVQDAGRGVRDVVSEAQFAQRGAQDAVGGERVLLEETFSARSHPWVLDHRPTFTVPALPMTVLADLMARALRAEGATRFDLSNLRALRWVTVHPTARVRVLRRGGELVLQQWRDARDPRLSRFEDAATAEARAPAGLEELAPLGSTRVFEPYERLFHGPAFQLLRRAEEGASGATSTLEARLGSAGHVPKGVLHPALLDAATHAIPHDSLHRWGDFPNDHVAYPHRLDLEWRRAPEGEAVRCETRLQRVEEGPGGPLPVFRIDVFDGAGCFARLRLVEVLLPKGPLGEASPSARRAFLESRRFVPGLALSDVREAGVTRVLPTAVATSDWLPGTIASVYGTPTRPSSELVAMKDHVAQLEGVHPSQVRVAGQVATNLHRPLRSHALSIESGAVSSRRSALNLEAVQSFWETRFGLRDWPVADLYYGLCQQFIDDVIVTDPDAFAAIRGRSALFLANHQTGIESLLFGILAGALQQTPVLTLAKDAHRESWLGKLIALGFEYPGAHDPGVIAFFNREDPASLPTIIQGLGAAAGASARGPRSLLVHVEGTRQLSARQPMASMSGVFVDLAIASDLPIVPVAFSGGLPVEPLETRAEFPIGRGGGFGKQQITLGAPILADSLRSMTYKDRNALVLDALRGLRSGSETPLASDASFRSERRPGAVARAVLQRAESPSAATRALLGEAVAVDTRVAAWLKGLEAWLNARP
ncbi:MAG: polyketide synthase dehydratase domain-containing protein [Myxococcota bacterium]